MLLTFLLSIITSDLWSLFGGVLRSLGAPDRLFTLFW